jgi:NAD(P)-dependent dehydrogenase (short-subunit alcohol dehydrogenase family)
MSSGNGSVCAIVGAGEGLGASLARVFASQGCDIGLISRTPAGTATAHAAATEANTGVRVERVQADASDPESLKAGLARVAVALGPVDILIYNVRGAIAFRRPLDVSCDELRDILEIEVIGALAATQAVLPSMIERGRGTILYSSATAALRGSATGLLYSTAKFGLRGLSQSVAKAYAPQGVHVAHVRLDCALDVPIVREMMGKDYRPELTANTDDVARTYWWVHQQPRSAWSNEVELRPFTENWTV